jgi:hypothetical protein
MVILTLLNKMDRNCQELFSPEDLLRVELPAVQMPRIAYD